MRHLHDLSLQKPLLWISHSDLLAMSWIDFSSTELAVTIFLILIVLWLLRILIVHRFIVKIRLNHFLLKPLKKFCSSCTTFIQARLSLQGLFGLHFTVGTTVIVIAGSLFGVIAENVVSGDSLTILDAQVAHWLHAHSTPIVTQCLLLITHLHDPIIISFMVALIAFFLIWKKRWYEVFTVLLVVPGGMLLNLLVKQVFQRARPTFEQPLVILTTYSFPSGHVVATTLFYGMLAALLISQAHKWTRNAFVVLIAFALVALVAFSRLYLGAHYLSDVLAGFLEGLTWLAFCLTAIHVYIVSKKVK